VKVCVAVHDYFYRTMNNAMCD